MARIPGLKFEKDAKGNNRYVRIDLKKHAEALAPFLMHVGAVKNEDDYDEEFEKKFKSGLTMDETFGDVIKYIKTLPWKK